MKLENKFKNTYSVECFDPDGNLKWTREFENLVVDEGLTDSLQKYFKGSGYTAAFYVGLTGPTPTFATGDTMATHPGWVEVSAYSEAFRPNFQPDDAADKAIDNATNKATFTINSNGTTVGGAFLSTDNTKSGTSGTLYGGGDFTQGDTVANDGDTISVTITITSSSS